MSLVSDAIEPGLHTEAAATVALFANEDKLSGPVKQERSSSKQTPDTELDLRLARVYGMSAGRGSAHLNVR